MVQRFEITAEPRGAVGKGASRRLRREHWVPGIVYGGGREPTPIMVRHNELVRQLESEAFYSHILTLTVGESKEQVVLKDLQRHPAKPFIQHVDLQRIRETEKIRLHVPLHFIGEDRAPGLKQGGIVSHNMNEVEITCFPRDLPEFIDVDVSSLSLGEAIHLSELSLPAGVELVGFVEGEGQDLTVMSIHGARAVSEPGAEQEGEEEGAE